MRFPTLPYYDIAAGIRSQLGTVLPPGGEVVAYVRASGPQTREDKDIKKLLVTSLNTALARCRANRGDIVILLPGHTESISAADAMSNLVAGTRIIGVGRGTDMPTLTWTAAAATFLLDVENVELSNIRMYMAGASATGALTVAAPITISAAGCTIRDCLIHVGWDADSLATIPITTTAAADDLQLLNNHFYGATAAEVTTVLQLVGADRLRMANCHFMAATSAAAVGVVRFLTTASTDIVIEDCTFANRKASSSSAVLGMAGASGIIRRCSFGILDDATLAGLTTPGNLQGFDNKTANLAGEQGAATTTVST